MSFEATALSCFGVLVDVLLCGGHDALLRIVDLRGTIGRKPCPLSCQISRAFMALAWFLCVVATSDRGTEKPVLKDQTTILLLKSFEQDVSMFKPWRC